MDNNTKTQIDRLAEILHPYLREGEDANTLAKELVTDFNLRFVVKSYWKRSLGGYFVCPVCDRVRTSNDHEFCDSCGAMMQKTKPKKIANRAKTKEKEK